MSNSNLIYIHISSWPVSGHSRVSTVAVQAICWPRSIFWAHILTNFCICRKTKSPETEEKTADLESQPNI